jgi:hypothetical protein
MDIQRETIRHFLAALAYRTQKALRGYDKDFSDFSPGNGTRTPKELVRHMASVLGVYRAEPLPDFSKEIERFHKNIKDLSAHLAAGTGLREISLTQLLQGPISDAMTHAGQLAMLRRLAGSPVESENFIFAEISPDRLGIEQPMPAAPGSVWLGKLIHLSWRLNKFLSASKKTQRSDKIE